MVDNGRLAWSVSVSSMRATAPVSVGGGLREAESIRPHIPRHQNHISTFTFAPPKRALRTSHDKSARSETGPRDRSQDP